MATIVSTFGTTEGFVKSALMGLGATQKSPNGRYYIDGNMVNVELSQVIAEAIYIEEIFRDGQSVTGKYITSTDGNDSGAVRIMLDTPFGMTSRTLGYGGRLGTRGNSGIINSQPPLLPTNNEIMVYLNQVNDQMLLFPDMSKTMIPLDVMAKKISAYVKSVIQDRSASTLAEVIAYCIFRSLNDGDNINQFDGAKDNAYGNLIADLNSKFDNGDIVSGAYTYSTEGRTMIGRPAFINNIFSSKSGVILNGSNMAQEMLKNYDLDVNRGDRNYVGTGYRGQFGQFHFQSAPDYIWFLAEKYLELPQGALNNFKAVAVSFEATAVSSIVDLGIKIIDAQPGRGVLVQPLNKWGHEAFRLSQLIGDSTLTNDYLTTTLGFKPDERVYPIAPNQANTNMDSVNVPIYGEDGSIIGYKAIANGIKPNGGNWQSGLPRVSAPVADPRSTSFKGASQDVILTTSTESADIYYTLDGTIPTSGSTKYTAAISVTATTTVKAFAVKSGMVPSEVITETYTKTV